MVPYLIKTDVRYLTVMCFFSVHIVRILKTSYKNSSSNAAAVQCLGYIPTISEQLMEINTFSGKQIFNCNVLALLRNTEDICKKSNY